MSDLIARLEAATGPDRELDCAIALKTGWYVYHGDNWIGPHGQICVPDYTSSLDAALTLVGDRLMTLTTPIMPDMGGKNWSATVGRSPAVRAKAPTPALALCIAALKARTPGGAA